MEEYSPCRLDEPWKFEKLNK